MSPDREPSPTSVIPSARKDNGLKRDTNLTALSAKSLPAFAGDFIISPRDGPAKGEGELAPQGLVRADLASLSTLDRRAHLETGPAENGVQVLGLGKAWNIDLDAVMCMNLIASGAFGSVYYGRYREKEVAVKILNPPSEVSDAVMKELADSFQSEVGVWHGLSHPNIVQFYGASAGTVKTAVKGVEGQKPGAPVWAIVTEYLSGGTIKDLLKKQRRHPWKVVVSIARGIASGLEYLHSQGIVHRDIKSDNLLLDSHKNVKIADFGVARIEAANPVDMTSETGTVRWMAPEIIDHQPYTKKVDVYSFGIVLWELCTGDHPFRELTMLQLAYQVVNKGLRPRIPEYVPKELGALMRRCWDQEASRRPDFADVIKELDRIDRGLGEEKDTRAPLQKLFGACFGGGK